MTRGETRERIVAAGAELIASQGFGATGLNAILAAAGVPKGSFYHYFPSKDDFGLAVIDHYAEAHDARLAATLADGGRPPLERLRAYFAAGVEGMASGGCARGCLIGDLAQELAAHSEAFRARIDAVFRRWEGALAECIGEAQARGEAPTRAAPGELAAFALAGWEGAILRAKVVGSVAPMERFASLFIDEMLQARPAA